MVFLGHYFTDSFFAKDLPLAESENVFFFKKCVVCGEVAFMCETSNSFVENSSNTAFCCHTIEKFFVTLVLRRTLSWNLLSDLEFSFDNDVAKMIHASFLNWLSIFVHDHLRHLE